MRLFGLALPPSLDDAVLACRDHFRLGALLSALVNLLYLAPTLYMMQIYDRAVPTGGVVTLLWLTAVVTFALATLAILDGLRMRVMIRAGVRLDKRLAETILQHIIGQRPKARGGAQGTAVMREFDSLRQAIAGTAATAVFDIPWVPIYILVATLVHPLLGALAVVSCGILLAITIVNERRNRQSGRTALNFASAAYMAQERLAQRSDLIRALGMRRPLIKGLLAERQRGLHMSVRQQFEAGTFASLAKFSRLLLQSLALGVGAWLAIEHQISAGSIIAASVLLSRSLQPIEMLVGSWASIAQARQAIDTLGPLLAEADEAHPHFDLPAPKGRLAVQNVSVRAPSDEARNLLTDISFSVDPGELVGIVGPSGAGKSTLARVLAGAMTPDEGTVRIDGADMVDWDPDRLATHIGYLPQDPGLFPGTIAENISKFAVIGGMSSAETAERVVAAARLAGAHDMILNLPGGYDRRLGWNADELSAGQRQRIGLARALYGDPKLLILDEPNSALDAEGENALLRAVRSVRKSGVTVLLVTHRAAILADATRLLVLLNGSVSMFGPYAEVAARLRKGAPPALAEVEAA